MLERLLSELRADDVVVVTRLDRLARSTSELLRIAETIEEKNAGLQSIAEPWADTTTPAGRMVLTVFAGIAEFERSLIAARTEEGRRAAQARGVPFGRPPKLRPDQRTLARNLIEEGKSVSDVARQPGPSMSMSQRSIAVSTMRRPYDSTPFRSHARSNSAEVNGSQADHCMHAPQGQRSARLKVIASNGRMLTGSSSFALAISSHCPSCSSNASSVRSTGSMSQRCAIPSRA